MESNLLQPENNNNSADKAAGKVANWEAMRSQPIRRVSIWGYWKFSPFCRILFGQRFCLCLLRAVRGSSLRPKNFRKNFTWAANCIAKSSSKMHDSQFGCGLPKPIWMAMAERGEEEEVYRWRCDCASCAAETEMLSSVHCQQSAELPNIIT